MPALEIHHADGRVETRELSRSQPLSVGRQPFNDICVPEDGIGAMHCRILWSKTGFEVAAATPGGVEVNGTTVAHSMLEPGDLIRVGSLDLVYSDPTAASDEPELRLKSEPQQTRPEPKSAPPAAKSTTAPADKPRRPNKVEPKPVEDLSLFEGPVYTESQLLQAADDFVDDDVENDHPKPLNTGRSARPVAAAPPHGGITMMSSRARPGEQDIFQSPLVMALSIGGMILLLVTGIFWFLIAREQASRLYDRAVVELNDGQYSQSIASFEQFLQKYSGHSLQKQAIRGLEKAHVQKEISGATPAWKRGMDRLKEMIAAHRNESDFKDLHPTLYKYAEDIALGAAKTAETARDASLLIVSEDAQAEMERFADPVSPPTAALSRIKEAREAAVIAIGKQKMFDDAMTAVDAALKAKKPMDALAVRERLVRAYEGFSSQKRVREALQKALDLERSVVITDDTEREADTKDAAPPASDSLLGVFHTRTRTDEASLGRVVFVVGKDSCYAVDTVTGELVWRRVIGFNSPFFPVNANGSQAVVLMFDGRQSSLLCCKRATGELIWRQPLKGRPQSAPLVQEGQIYLPTADRSLCRIDLETGRLTARVVFSQNVQGPPVLSHDGQHLLVPGEMAMIYALSMRPLAAVSTTFTDHAAGSISAPPLAMGRLLLLCENDKSDSARLRLWDASMPTAPLVELSSKSVRLRGQVREPPVLRGNQLVVPSSGENLAAFNVTDDAGRAGLLPVAQYRVNEDDEVEKREKGKNEDGKSGAKQPETENDPVKEGETEKQNAKPKMDKPARNARLLTGVPIFVALGADGQFWAASSAFRHFDIGSDAIHMDSNAVAQGIASQPLQLVGDQFFVGRKAIFHDAVVFSAVERDRMVSPWRIVLGNELLEVVPARDGGAISVSEAGQVVVLGAARLGQGGFDLKAAAELELPPKVDRPLVASSLHDGRILLAATGEQTQLWLVNAAGQTDFTTKLNRDDALQANAVLLDEGLVLPLAGRLKCVPVSGGRKSVQDWLAPLGEEATPAWRRLLRLDKDELIACDARGQLIRVQIRTGDVPNLAGVAKLQLDHPVDVDPALRGDMLMVADSAGNALHLNARTFDYEGRRAFVEPVRGVWLAGQSNLVWSGDGKLHSVTAGRDLPIRWSLDLKGSEPAGAPLERNDQLWIACRDGTVLVVDISTGRELRRILIPQVLRMGLKVLGDGMYAVASDGTMYRADHQGGNEPQ
jgi:outer membrane protein assembly factor BamB